MDEQLTISTPEQVAFHYETAGIGSRFVAALIDHLIVFTALLLINCAAFALVPALGAASRLGGGGESAGVYVLLAALTIISFLVFWGYFVLFEVLWQGRTPGKRMGKLRVLRRSGQPIGAGEAVIRNLVRLVDFLPGFYAIGLISMFVDRDARRLGDMAAGTIVVREGEQVGLRDVRVSQATAQYDPVPAHAQSHAPYTGYAVSEGTASGQPDPLPGVSLHGITPDDYRLVREMLERVRRGELQRDRAYELSSRLAYSVASRIGHNFSEWQQRGWDPVVFLESVLKAREARES